MNTFKFSNKNPSFFVFQGSKDAVMEVVKYVSLHKVRNDLTRDGEHKQYVDESGVLNVSSASVVRFDPQYAWDWIELISQSIIRASCRYAGVMDDSLIQEVAFEGRQLTAEYRITPMWDDDSGALEWQADFVVESVIYGIQFSSTGSDSDGLTAEICDCDEDGEWFVSETEYSAVDEKLWTSMLAVIEGAGK